MKNANNGLPTNATHLLTDLAGLPILLFWAGLSIVPLGALFAGDAATLRYWISAFFLCSGLWGAMVLYFGAKLLMWSEARNSIRLPGRPVTIGYALVWSVLFLAFYISSKSIA